MRTSSYVALSSPNDASLRSPVRLTNFEVDNNDEDSPRSSKASSSLCRGEVPGTNLSKVYTFDTRSSDRSAATICEPKFPVDPVKSTVAPVCDIGGVGIFRLDKPLAYLSRKRLISSTGSFTATEMDEGSTRVEMASDS